MWSTYVPRSLVAPLGPRPTRTYWSPDLPSGFGQQTVLCIQYSLSYMLDNQNRSWVVVCFVYLEASPFWDKYNVSWDQLGTEIIMSKYFLLLLMTKGRCHVPKCMIFFKKSLQGGGVLIFQSIWAFWPDVLKTLQKLRTARPGQVVCPNLSQYVLLVSRGPR